MEKHKLPRNQNLPEGISLLRQLNAKANSDTINLGLGKPEIDMPGNLRTLVIDCLQNAKLEYTENAGDLLVREALASKLNLREGKALILTHGAQEALSAALLAILNTGDEVLIPDPGFLSYSTQVKMFGAKPVSYPLLNQRGTFVHEVNQIQSKITTRTRALILSTPGNPSGCDLSEEERNALFRLAEIHHLIIISDEVYGMLHFKKNYQPLASLHEQVISVNSFSKSHALTGWRIGFLACQNAKVLQACLVAHQYLTTCASVPAQRLLGKLLQSTFYESIPTDFRNAYESKISFFLKQASPAFRAKIPAVCGGFYLFPQLPESENDFDFCEKVLKEKNILMIPGSLFGAEGKKAFRLSLALPDESLLKAAHAISGYY